MGCYLDCTTLMLAGLLAQAASSSGGVSTAQLLILAVLGPCIVAVVGAYLTSRFAGKRELAAETRAIRRQNEVAAAAKKSEDERTKIAKDAAARAVTVAEVAAEAARLLQSAQVETAKKTEEVATALAANTEATATKLDALAVTTDAIHTLSNSQRTESFARELGQARVSRVFLERLMGVGKPSAEDAVALESLDRTITELESNLADRDVQLKKVEADAATAREN